MFSFETGSPFGVASVDLAAYSTVIPDTVIHFVGYRADGGMIVTDVERHGINFETYYFDPDWSSGLTRVEIPTYGWSLDNLVISVPEPTTNALLLAGALGVRFLASR